MSTEQPQEPPRGRGRPPADEPRSETLRVRLTKAEKAAVLDASMSAEENPSEWARHRLLSAAKRAKPKSA